MRSTAKCLDYGIVYIIDFQHDGAGTGKNADTGNDADNGTNAGSANNTNAGENASK